MYCHRTVYRPEMQMRSQECGNKLGRLVKVHTLDMVAHTMQARTLIAQYRIATVVTGFKQCFSNSAVLRSAISGIPLLSQIIPQHRRFISLGYMTSYPALLHRRVITATKGSILTPFSGVPPIVWLMHEGKYTTLRGSSEGRGASLGKRQAVGKAAVHSGTPI